MTLTIAITGAGIGGLAVASLLARDGHEVTIFERFDTPHPVGSGLVIQPAGMAVLEELGLSADVTLLAEPITKMLGHDARAERKALDVDYPANAPGYAFHRASLFHLLWHLATQSDIQVITSAAIKNAPLVGGHRTIILQDGREFGSYDLIVDACGAGFTIVTAASAAFGVWGALDQCFLARNRLAAKSAATAISRFASNGRGASHWSPARQPNPDGCDFLVNPDRSDW